MTIKEFIYKYHITYDSIIQEVIRMEIPLKIEGIDILREFLKQDLKKDEFDDFVKKIR